MAIDLKRLEVHLKADRLSVEDKIESDQLVLDIQAKLDDKEVYVEEPDDIDDEVVMVWTEDSLKKLREAAVVAIANELGIDASVKDKKSDTIKAILENLK